MAQGFTGKVYGDAAQAYIDIDLVDNDFWSSAGRYHSGPLSNSIWYSISNGSAFTLMELYNAYAAKDHDWWGWNIWIPRGTYTFNLVGLTNSDRAKADVSLDGTVVGTIDQYSAGAVYNVPKTITNIVITEPKEYILKIEINGRNVSSSGWFFMIQQMAFIRTA